jgi:hypothetical protein
MKSTKLKQIDYILEFLSKGEQKESKIYESILDFLGEQLLYTSSSFSRKSLITLANKEGFALENDFDAMLKRLDTLLQENLHAEIKEAKSQLFETLISSNFKKKKEQFDKVETSIYKCLSSYIFGLTRGLEIFYIYSLDNVKEPEVFIEYANTLHVKLFEEIFNESEKALLEEKLKEIMSVYLSLYARYLYM